MAKPVAWMGEHYPVTLVRLRYLARFHRLPNLKNPIDLNEKILYLKLFTDTSEWTRLADKYKVRDYVRSCGLEDILIRFMVLGNEWRTFHSMSCLKPSC